MSVSVSVSVRMRHVMVVMTKVVRERQRHREVSGHQTRCAAGQRVAAQREQRVLLPHRLSVEQAVGALQVGGRVCRCGVRVLMLRHHMQRMGVRERRDCCGVRNGGVQNSRWRSGGGRRRRCTATATATAGRQREVIRMRLRYGMQLHLRVMEHVCTQSGRGMRDGVQRSGQKRGRCRGGGSRR